MANRNVMETLFAENQPAGISVVLPLYNERESLEELHRRLSAVLQGLKQPYEILFVDDGSSDGSSELLQVLCRKDPHCQKIRFRRNFGKAAALNAGFKKAQYGLVISMDADLQDVPEEIPSMLGKIAEGYDLVSSWKQNRQDPWSKLLASRWFNFFTCMVTGIRIHDINSGFKCYRRQVIEEISVYGDMHRYIPVLASYRGFRVGEIKVSHERRRYGASKYGPGRYFGGFFDLLTVIMLTRYNRKPLHIFGIIGALLFGAGFLIDAYLAIGWFFQHWIGDRPLLLLGTLLMIVGVQFICFGLLAEMIAFSAVDRDDYSIVEEKAVSGPTGKTSNRQGQEQNESTIL